MLHNIVNTFIDKVFPVHVLRLFPMLSLYVFFNCGVNVNEAGTNHEPVRLPGPPLQVESPRSRRLFCCRFLHFWNLLFSVQGSRSSGKAKKIPQPVEKAETCERIDFLSFLRTPRITARATSTGRLRGEGQGARPRRLKKFVWSPPDDHGKRDIVRLLIAVRFKKPSSAYFCCGIISKRDRRLSKARNRSHKKRTCLFCRAASFLQGVDGRISVLPQKYPAYGSSRPYWLPRNRQSPRWQKIRRSVQ